MQLLWNLLHAPGNHLERPLPQLNISSGFDSLEPPSLFSELEEMDVTPWSEMDNDKYSLVIGNPPYVRPERRVTTPTKGQEEFFAPIGAKSNLYGLFIYKALTQWLEDDGKLGFVIPLTFVDTEDSAKLRDMFKIGGPWKILEIVDMEEIKRMVFPSANVRPIILIAQKKAATAEDKVTLRIADRNCVKKTHEGENLRFDLDGGRSSEVPYQSIWSYDGRIVTRLTQERSELVSRLAKLPNFESITHKYWDRMEGSKIVERKLERGESDNHGKWTEKRFLMWGGAARGKDSSASSGPALYKGENLLPCQLVGEPLKPHVDAQRLDDASVWRFPDSMPQSGVAFSRISMFPVGVTFNPRDVVFLNTATLFFPIPELGAIPFDFLVLATAYRWFYAVYVRQGVIADFFSQAYPKAIGTLPWHDSIAEKTQDLISLRSKFLEACRTLAHGKQVLAEELDRVGVMTLKERVEQSEGMQLRWGEVNFAAGEDAATFHRVQYGDSLFEFVEVNDKETADQLELAVRIFAEDGCSRDAIRALPLPRTGSEAEYVRAINQFEASKPMAHVESVLGELDNLVSPALGVSADEVAFMRDDLAKDALFSKLILRLPYQEKTLRGILENLTSSKRYS